MKMRIMKLLSLMLMVVLSVTVSGCTAFPDDSAGKDDTEVSEYHFVMAEENPADTIVGRVDKAFADKVEELSGGLMTVDIVYSGEKGTEFQIVSDIADGKSDVDICRISAFVLNNFGCQKPKLLSLPFTFESEEHFWKFAESDLAQEFLDEPIEYNLGVRGLFFGEEGFRHFFSNKPISSITDLKGMRIRVSNDLVMTGMAESLGGTPLQVKMEKISESFSSDDIDAAEQPIVNYQANNYYSVAPYVMLDGHTLGVTEMLISDEAWQSLSKAQQDILIQASKFAREYNQGLTAKDVEDSINALKSEGVEFVEIDDKAPFRNASAGLIKEQTEGLEDVYQKIRDMSE